MYELTVYTTIVKEVGDHLQPHEDNESFCLSKTLSLPFVPQINMDIVNGFEIYQLKNISYLIEAEKFMSILGIQYVRVNGDTTRKQFESCLQGYIDNGWEVQA